MTLQCAHEAEEERSHWFHRKDLHKNDGWVSWVNTSYTVMLPILKQDEVLILFTSNPGPTNHKEGNVCVHENSNHIESARLVL